MTPEREALAARIDAALRPLVIYESTDGTTTRRVLADDALRLQSVLRECRAELAAPAPTVAQDQIGGQGHEANVRCSLGASPLESGNAREATCLNSGPSARIGADTQQGQLGANAGSIPAPPTTPAQGEPLPVIWCEPGWRAHPTPDAFNLTQTERHTVPLFDDTAIAALRTIWIKHWMLTRYSRNGLSGITCGSGHDAYSLIPDKRVERS